MNRSRSVVVCLALLAGGLSAPAALRAQQLTGEKTVEVSASVGFSNGLGSVDRFTNIAGLVSDFSNLGGRPVVFTPGSNNKWNLGVSVGYAVRSRLLLVGEVVRTQLENPTLTVDVSPAINPLEFNARLLEVTGGVQYEIPIRSSSVVPYVGAGLGTARSTLSLKNSTFNVLDVDASDNHFSVNFGGGARIHFSSRWGLRPEFKVVRISNETWVRTSVGVFFQFGS